MPRLKTACLAACALALPVAAQAQLAQSLGTPEGCAALASGTSTSSPDTLAIIPGHLNLYGQICIITAVQANTLMATCPGDEEARKKVLGITRTADGAGVALTLEDGRIEELYPCE